MKQWHWTLVLVVICGGLAFYSLKYERGAVPEGPLVFKFAPDKCTKIVLTPAQEETTSTATKEKAKKKPAVVLVKSGDEWRIEKPFPARADQQKVKDLIDRIKNLVIKDPLTNNPTPEDLKDYGLKTPKAKLTVYVQGKKPMTLLLGGKNIDSTRVYTMKQGDKGVFLIGTLLWDDVNKKVDDYRDKDALSFEKDQVMKLRLTRGKTKLEIAKKNLREKESTSTESVDKEKKPEFDYDWWLIRPVKAKAVKYDCDTLVTKLDDLKIDKWVDNNPKDLAKYGLDKPQLKADVWVGTKKRPRSLLVGKPAKDDSTKLYAINTLDKPVFLVDKSILDDLKKEPKDLRDKDILSFEKDKIEKFSIAGHGVEIMCRKTAHGEEEAWQVLKPTEMKADKKKIDDILWDLDGVRANEFIDKPAADATYGLDKPQYTVKLWSEGKEGETTMVVGKLTPKNDNVYVKLKGEKTVYEVGKSLLDDLKIDRKKLRDRTVIAFSRDDLTRLELKFGKKHVVLEKHGFDWKMTKPKEMDADSSSVSNLLWKFEDFHADEYVGPAPKNLSKYGFDKPQAQITFYLRRKRPQTVVIGKTEKGKVYVMLKGGKSVFRHSDSLLDDVQKDPDSFKKKPPVSGQEPPY